MIYNTYQELVDKLNALLKEREIYKNLLDSIPLSLIIQILNCEEIDINIRKKWWKLYYERDK